MRVKQQSSSRWKQMCVLSRPTAEKVGKRRKRPRGEEVPAEDSGGERSGPGAEPRVV